MSDAEAKSGSMRAAQIPAPVAILPCFIQSPHSGQAQSSRVLQRYGRIASAGIENSQQVNRHGPHSQHGLAGSQPEDTSALQNSRVEGRYVATVSKVTPGDPYLGLRAWPFGANFTYDGTRAPSRTGTHLAPEIESMPGLRLKLSCGIRESRKPEPGMAMRAREPVCVRQYGASFDADGPRAAGKGPATRTAFAPLKLRFSRRSACSVRALGGFDVSAAGHSGNCAGMRAGRGAR
jgi:hypothetical protein